MFEVTGVRHMPFDYELNIIRPKIL